MQDTTKNNKLIAEFMGYEFSKSGLTARIGKGKKPSAYRIADLHYHNSWNLLMPVVEKIESIPDIYFDIYREASFVKHQPNEIKLWWIAEYDQETKINHVYKAVLKFITWYNSQPKQS